MSRIHFTGYEGPSLFIPWESDLLYYYLLLKNLKPQYINSTLWSVSQEVVLPDVKLA